MKKILGISSLVLALSGCVHYNEFRKEVDLNKDSRLDIVELKDKAVYVQLRLPYDWDGQPTYTEPRKMSEDFNKVTNMEVKDADKDGDLDLVYYMGAVSEPYIRMRYGNGDGTFSVEVGGQ